MRSNSILVGTVFFCSLVSTSFGVIASFQGVEDLPGGGATPNWSIVANISGDGSVVVGTSNSALGREAFLWTQVSGIVRLGDLPGGDFRSNAQSISADGSVIVGSSESSLGKEAFRWTAETGMVGLGDLIGGDFSSIAYGVSADGSVVVGEGDSASGSPSEAFRWTAETGMEGLGDLPGGRFISNAYGVSADGSVIVGSSSIGDDLYGAFRWVDINGNGVVDPDEKLDNRAEFSLFDQIWTRAYSVSADGSVVVGYGSEAFRWTSDSGMVGLGDLPGGDFRSVASDVSADGSVVVGWSETGLNRHEPFIWDEINEMRNLRDLLVNDYGLDLTGWILTSATAISDDGLTIVGAGYNPSGDYEGWIATIPKPAIEVAVDIKPGSCPNPVNVKSSGVLPIAILGTEDVNVITIDPTSIRLAGVEPIRSGFEDVATPVSDSNDCNCITDGPDGFLDLTLKFETQRIIEAIGDVNDGDVRVLTLTGVLFDPMPFETPIEGADCILIRGRHKPINPADINKDGVVNAADFAIFAQNWLQSSIVDE